MILVFDLESNGLLDEATVIHSLCIGELDSGKVHSFADQEGYQPISKGIEMLQKADMIIAHNGICFDVPVIKKITGVDLSNVPIYDTLVASRVLFGNLYKDDWKFRRKGMDVSLYGRHKLEAWGHRLGLLKGDFKGPWDKWSKEMQDYCALDIDVCRSLYLKQRSLGKVADPTSPCILNEMEFQKVIFRQEQIGVPVNREAILDLIREIDPKIEDITKRLTDKIPFIEHEEEFIPKRDNTKMGYKKGQVFIKKIQTPFNPGSRNHILHFLQSRYNWQPIEFTEKNNPKMGREQLEFLPYPEIPDICEYFDASKVRGFLYSGEKSLLNFYKNGRIHGRVNTNGAITGRCTHSDPNLAQVPSIRAYKGKECRAIFHAPEGFKMVGADASSLELRILGHYLSNYDGGAFASEVVDGDVHTRNQKDAGLSTRDDAKTFIYAFLYGAGDAKLGSIVEPSASVTRQTSVGGELRATFFSRNPAIARLVHDVDIRFKRNGYLIGLDGRLLYPKKGHSALNTLIQGGGAVVMKAATWRQWVDMPAGAVPALNIHDENQIIAPNDLAEECGEVMVGAIRGTKSYLNLKCLMDGQYKIGQNWAETH